MPNDLTRKDIINWRSDVIKNAKPITWNGYLRHMRSVYNFAIDAELISLEKNPFLKLTLKTGKEKKKTLSKSQLARLHELLTSSEHLPQMLSPRWFISCLVCTLQYTGIRRAQLTKLQIKDINLDEKIIAIPSHINKNHNYHEIPIADKLLPHLRKLIDELKNKGKTENDQIFNINVFSKTTLNSEMTVEQVSYIFKLISKEVRFNVSCHRFRHTIATQLMKNTDNLYHVQQLLGHRDISITLSYIEYEHEMLRNCVNSL